MTNSNSFADESATDSTTNKKENATALMSAGAEMLIERMKTNPEDFSYNGRFYRVVEVVRPGAPLQGWISTRDIVALRSAYEECIQEPEFSEWVYGEIFTPKEPAQPNPNIYTQNLAQSMMQTKNAMAAQSLNAAFGNRAMPMNSNGNIGVGTNSPATTLTVSANNGNPQMTLGQTTLTESMLQQVKNKLGI